MKENLLIAYAVDFASFLIARPTDTYKKISRIVLFGSVARGDAGEKSDVDIFIDTSDERKVELEVESAKKEFYESIKFKKYWRLLGVENDIRCVVGRLEEWKDLQKSLISDGILLYGKYAAGVEITKHLTILGWGTIKPETKRVLFNKRMFGYRQKGKSYPGVLQKSGAHKLDNAIIVPLENANDVLKLFRNMRIKVEIMDVGEY